MYECVCFILIGCVWAAGSVSHDLWMLIGPVGTLVFDWSYYREKTKQNMLTEQLWPVLLAGYDDKPSSRELPCVSAVFEGFHSCWGFERPILALDQ